MRNQFVVRFPFSIRMSQLTSNTSTLLFFSFFACLFTRGFFQLFVPSGLTMVIQVLSLGMITSVLLFLYPKEFYFREGGFFLIVSLFIATGSLGAFLTG